MASELENLRKQLALAVRSIQWSYAIFWTISTSQPTGVLEWGDGYYNGDIKTRKTVQAIELNADEMGLQRSVQLRELYESLSAAETNPQARRPSAALSPEDLTDTEWYYLVCMSFTFNLGQGLPGRSLANGQPIWICNAPYADSKLFMRSLLAKSASVQTVVCFPYMEGVVEFGTTEMVLEDPNLILHTKATFLEIPFPNISNQINSCMENMIIDENPEFNPLVEFEQVVEFASPDNSSNGFDPNHQMIENWQFIDDEFSNCVHNSVTSSDCISQTLENPEKVISFPKGGKVNDASKLPSLGLDGVEMHYGSIVSSLLKNTSPLVLGPYFSNGKRESSFVRWTKREGLVDYRNPTSETSQKLLKKVLFEVAWMHSSGLFGSRENPGRKYGIWRPENDKMGGNEFTSESMKRERLNDRFSVLQSLVPSVSKVDKVSILDNTIEYLKELEKRVEELESSKESPKLETRTSIEDSIERTSDNYAKEKLDYLKKPLLNKRKAIDIDEKEHEISPSVDAINVKMKGREVLIEMRCAYKDNVLIEIVDSISNFHLDSHSVQSSIIDGVLFLTIKSKFKGSMLVSAGVIKQGLQRVVNES